jgi:hypothetical protein
MLERWSGFLRDRGADHRRGYQAVQGKALDTYRKAMAEYDAFVPHARAVSEGLLLGTATDSSGEEIPIRLALDDDYTTLLVQGTTGSGKTTWIASLLGQELSAHRGVGVIDAKGDLFDTAIRLAAAVAHGHGIGDAERERTRLVVVNPFSDHLVPFNVCRLLPGETAETRAYEVVLAFSRFFEAGLGFHQESIFRAVLLLAIEAGLTLVEVPLILEDEVLRGILANRSTNPTVKDFFLRTYPVVPAASKQALVSRLQGLLLSENIRLMLGAEDLLDLRTIFDRGDPLFVFLGRGPGVAEEQVEILGSLFFQVLLQAAYARGTGQRERYLLIFDEFAQLLEAPGLSRRLETGLTTGRSFGLRFSLVHQNFAQLPTSLREIILANSDLIALFRTSGRNAILFGDFLPSVDPELVALADLSRMPSREEGRRLQLEALQRLPNRTCFFYDRRRPYRAIRLRAPDVRRSNELLGLSPERFERLIEREGWLRGGAGVPRAELKSQIEARARRLKSLIRPPADSSGQSRSSERGPGGPRRPRLG